MIDLADLGMEPEWRRAIAYFDDGDPSHVAEVLKSDVPMSKEVLAFLADAISGKRKPRTIGKARQLLTHEDRQWLQVLALHLHVLRTLDPADVDLTARAFNNMIREERDQVIAAIVKRSGASIGTVEQAWKAANRRYAGLAKRRKLMTKRQQLRSLSNRNDPFGRSR